MIIFTKFADGSLYEYAVRTAWIGGKKNDVIVMVGAANYPNIDWVRVMSWSSNQMFNVKLRDDLLEQKVANRMTFIQTVSDDIRSLYQRKSMKEFKYLDAEINPPNWMIVLLIVVLVGGNVGLWVFLWYDENRYRLNTKRYNRCY